MNFRWWLVCILIFSSSVRLNASNLDLDELNAIKKAQTSEDLEKSIKLFERLRVLLRACEIQNQELRLPAACFAAYKLSQQIVPQQINGLELKAIENSCLVRAQIAKTIVHDEIMQLPPSCQKVASARMRILNYKRGIEIEN